MSMQRQMCVICFLYEVHFHSEYIVGLFLDELAEFGQLNQWIQEQEKNRYPTLIELRARPICCCWRACAEMEKRICTETKWTILDEFDPEKLFPQTSRTNTINFFWTIFMKEVTYNI